MVVDQIVLAVVKKVRNVHVKDHVLVEITVIVVLNVTADATKNKLEKSSFFCKHYLSIIII